MATNYYVRVKCEDEQGNWHYHRATQADTIDENITCPTHPSDTISHFVIEREELTE